MESSDFEYKIFDRYNWDRGKSVRLLDWGPPWLKKSFTVTDDFMGEFQRQGLAREFNVVGSVKRTLNW